MEFKALCTVDGNEFPITEKDIKLAVARKGQTGGLALVSCPFCAGVYALEDAPDSPGKISAWIGEQQAKSDDWLACLPLEGVVAIEPMGGGIEMPPGSGRIFYKPGAGDTPGFPDGYPRWVYMYRCGLDPKVAWDLMQGKGKKG
jgi:hypothetical protein